MKIDFLQEPELEFGVDQHIDIRFGIMNYGPVDYASASAPKAIRLGIVGTNETVEGVKTWLARCKTEIPAKQSKQPCLFTKFPGFQSDRCFQSEVILDACSHRTIKLQLFDELANRKDGAVIETAVDLFYEELHYLVTNSKVDVLICAVPQKLLDLTQTSSDQDNETENDSDQSFSQENSGKLDFHHLLKAKCMSLNIPIQLIVPSTYDDIKRRRQKKNSLSFRKPQDEATRAWNFHTALYYKAGGVPWRLIRNTRDFATCYVGVSFYKSLSGTSMLTSVAQVFNERGEGIIVRGGPATFSKEDKQVHLNQADAEKLLYNALSLYKKEHGNFPARLVVHKTSSYARAEIDGFVAASRSYQVDQIDLISITKSFTRLFRIGSYPPLRGTFLSLDDKNHLLYTRGSIDFFQTYPGMYVPRPLMFRCEYTEQTPKFLAQEIMGLTKMNWNNTQFDGGDPITIRTARRVGEILKYVPDDKDVAPSYKFYM